MKPEITEYHLKRNYKKLSVTQDDYHGWNVKSDLGVIAVFNTEKQCEEWVDEYFKRSTEVNKDKTFDKELLISKHI